MPEGRRFVTACSFVAACRCVSAGTGSGYSANFSCMQVLALYFVMADFRWIAGQRMMFQETMQSCIQLVTNTACMVHSVIANIGK